MTTGKEKAKEIIEDCLYSISGNNGVTFSTDQCSNFADIILSDLHNAGLFTESTLLQEGEAVEFAKWIRQNAVWQVDEWVVGRRPYNDQQLYSLFKQRK